MLKRYDAMDTSNSYHFVPIWVIEDISTSKSTFIFQVVVVSHLRSHPRIHVVMQHI